jgi:hypothetical protein
MEVPVYVYVIQSAIVGHNGTTFRLAKGEVWAADDPVVLAHPDHFSKTPTVQRRSRPVQEARPVESATAGPGEKRATRKGSDRVAG